MTTLGSDLLQTIQGWIANKYIPVICGMAKQYGGNLTPEILAQALSVCAPTTTTQAAPASYNAGYAAPPPVMNGTPTGPPTTTVYATPGKCPVFVKSGPKAGQVCGAKLTDGGNTCFIHSKSKDAKRADYPPGTAGGQQTYGQQAPPYQQTTVTPPPAIVYSVPQFSFQTTGDMTIPGGPNLAASQPAAPSTGGNFLHLEQWRDNYLIHPQTGFVVKNSGGQNFVVGISQDRTNIRSMTESEKSQALQLGLHIETPQSATTPGQVENKQIVQQVVQPTQQPAQGNTQVVNGPPSFPQLGTGPFAPVGQPVGVTLDQVLANTATVNIV